MVQQPLEQPRLTHAVDPPIQRGAVLAAAPGQIEGFGRFRLFHLFFHQQPGVDGGARARLRQEAETGAGQLAPRTVGLLLGQDTLTVPDMRTKLRFQLAGTGFGFLPEPCARAAIDAGLLVEKQVEEPKPAETFYLAWRSGEHGAALNWWIARMRQPGLFERLLRHLPHDTRSV